MARHEKHCTFSHSLAGAAVALAVSALATPALSADARRGGELARQWCATCHIVDARPSNRRAVDRAPPFTQIAADESKPAAYLRGFLANPHFPMPNLDLGRREIDDLVAYIESLR